MQPSALRSYGRPQLAAAAVLLLLAACAVPQAAALTGVSAQDGFAGESNVTSTIRYFGAGTTSVERVVPDLVRGASVLVSRVLATQFLVPSLHVGCPWHRRFVRPHRLP